MSDSVLRALQHAAREYARLVHPGTVARRVIILDEYREKIAEIRVPAGDGLPAVGTVPTPLPTVPVQGWDFSEPWPRFDGTILQVSGKCLELLRALAESKGPLTVDELRRRVWPEYLAEEVTIRWTVKKLRGLLKEQVPLCEEPIVTRPEGGYVLTLR